MKILQRIARILSFSPYEGANYSSRRSRVPGAGPTDAKKELTVQARRELVRKSRYLHKNSGFAREVVGDMAIYSTGDGIRPQAQTEDPEWNRQAEQYFARWSARPEITNRFSFEECQNLVCRGIDVDGEYFVLKVRDRLGRARIQLVESHRVGSGADDAESIDGVLFDEFGAPLAYMVQQDDGTYRPVYANAVMNVFEPEFASGARGPAKPRRCGGRPEDPRRSLCRTGYGFWGGTRKAGPECPGDHGCRRKVWRTGQHALEAQRDPDGPFDGAAS